MAKRERESAVDFLTEVVNRKISQYNGVENAEVEARLCVLMSKTARNERLRLPIDSAAIVNAPHNINVGVDKNAFDRLAAAFTTAGYPSTTVTSETAAFNEGERVEKDSDGKVTAYVKKRKLNTIDIAIPSSPFDIRIGVATESPLDMEKVPEIPADAFIRRRTRTTYALPNGMAADFTVVGGNTARPTYEVEIEVTFSKLEASPTWISDLIQEAKSLIDIAKQRPPKPVVAAPVAPAVPVAAPQPVAEAPQGTTEPGPATA